MLTVRRRSIELATDSSTFSEDVPVATFEDPGRAKLEADAYLAVVINGLADTMVASTESKEAVATDFPERIVKARPEYAGKPNSALDLSTVTIAFRGTFLHVYSDENEGIKGLPETVLGGKTIEACGNYAVLADSYLGNMARFFRDHVYYKHPAQLIQVGMKTFSSMVVDGLVTANRSGLSVDERAGHLAKAERSLLGMASLSLFQNNSEDLESPAIKAGAIDLTPNLKAMRQRKKHHTERDEVIRPHHGCPAMPSVPETGSLVEGSPLGKLWQLATELIVTTNAHALDSDAPEHAILPVAA